MRASSAELTAVLAFTAPAAVIAPAVPVDGPGTGPEGGNTGATGPAVLLIGIHAPRATCDQALLALRCFDSESQQNGGSFTSLNHDGPSERIHRRKQYWSVLARYYCDLLSVMTVYAL